MPATDLLSSPSLTLVILAGGMGRRMNGQDKGLLPYREGVLIEAVLPQVTQQVSRILINANRNQQDYERFGFPVVADSLADFQGPLAGMLTAMKHVDTDYILTLPCDGPQVAPDYVAKMLEVRDQAQVPLVVASDGDRLQPVYALLATELAGSLESYLLSGERKIDRWYAQHPYAVAEFDPASGFFINLNKPEDLRQLAG